MSEKSAMIDGGLSKESLKSMEMGPKSDKLKKGGLQIVPTVGAALIDAKGARVEGLLPPNSPGHMSKREYQEIAGNRQSITQDAGLKIQKKSNLRLDSATTRRSIITPSASDAMKSRLSNI